MSDKNSIETILELYKESEKARIYRKALEKIKGVHENVVKKLSFSTKMEMTQIYGGNIVRKDITKIYMPEDIDKILEITFTALEKGDEIE